jgi:molybdopterin converting factor subunit 1
MHVSVRLFALAKERAQRSQVELELPAAATVADLRAALRARWPELAALWAHALIAVDQEYAEEGAIIPPGAELAVIPPVSGGWVGQTFLSARPRTMDPSIWGPNHR